MLIKYFLKFTLVYIIIAYLCYGMFLFWGLVFFEPPPKIVIFISQLFVYIPGLINNQLLKNYDFPLKSFILLLFTAMFFSFIISFLVQWLVGKLKK